MSRELPSSTYRLQLTPAFTLFDAAKVLPYLADLGVGAVYLSPVWQCAPGSTHGYDVVDPTRIDDARGGEAGWKKFVATAREYRLGIVVDVVPNHQCIAPAEANLAWWDVLRHGKQSLFARWFDIDWDAGPITLPILGDEPAQISVDAGDLVVNDQRLPLAAGTEHLTGDSLLAAQHYRLIHWRRANDELTYRRFFSIHSLAGVRVEDEQVFGFTHARLLQMVRDGDLVGIRVDHPDGLRDPAGYFERLRAAVGPNLWLIGEKILSPGERCPLWEWDGTVGYDATTELTQLLCDRSQSEAVTELYVDVTGDRLDAHGHESRGKAEVVDELFGSETARIARCEPDLDATTAQQAIGAIAAEFDVYRTYLPTGNRRLIDAVRRARSAHPHLASDIAKWSDRLSNPTRPSAFLFQQLTGPVVAKGVEDTACYRYARMIALNEVGGDMATFGISVEDFHQAMVRRQHSLPESMTLLSSHDTKRSEDVRARLLALAEDTAPWADFARDIVDFAALPDRTFAYFLAQTLIGVGPIGRERIVSALIKSVREASVMSTWTAVNADVEQRIADVLDWCFTEPQVSRWREVYADLNLAAFSNALAQKLVQLTMPGIPDVYQGTEVFDDSLVDPDNRRPVDFDELASWLPQSGPTWSDPSSVKMWVVRQTLLARRHQRWAFTDYRPVMAQGTQADHVVAFDRGGAIACAVRCPRSRGEWGETRIQLGWGCVDVITGRRYAPGTAYAKDLFGTVPVALLLSN